MAALVTVVVAVIGAGGMVAAGWLTSGRHLRRDVRAIRRNVGDYGEEGHTLVGDVSDIRADLWDLAASYLEHLYADHDHANPALPSRLAQPRRRRTP